MYAIHPLTSVIGLKLTHGFEAEKQSKKADEEELITDSDKEPVETKIFP